MLLLVERVIDNRVFQATLKTNFYADLLPLDPMSSGVCH
jgi:hypothetical protein